MPAERELRDHVGARTDRTRGRTWGTFVLAAATLGLETALTRVFALSQGHHFAFLAVSVGMLGMGAGGTLLACLPRMRNRAAIFVRAEALLFG